MPTGDQPITSTNIDPNIYRQMTSLGHNAFNRKLLYATPDINICLKVVIFIYNDSMAPVIWRTMVEIRDDFDKSVLVQVVDWCRQAKSNYLSQRRQNLATWRHQAKL